MSAKFHEERARVAVLSRYHPPDYPMLVAARRRMREQVLLDVIARALRHGPELTPELRVRIDALLAECEASVA